MSDKIKMAINGTGRIGICTARILGSREDIDLVAMNSTADIDTLLHLIKYDSVHGGYNVSKIDSNTLQIGNNAVKILSNRDINALDFLDATCLIECTGKFNSLEKSKAHLKHNIKKVVISAPADNTPTFVYGVNHLSYNNEEVISNASCTTNCLAPIAKVLHECFGIERGLINTIHSYTNDQNVLDSKHKDKRRARASALNMIPTSTGAAKAIGLVIPELQGRLNGLAIRVPTPNVSLLDLNVEVKSKVSKEDVLQAFDRYIKDKMQDILEIDYESRVSTDFIGSNKSGVIISDKIMTLENSIKILAWYDNEMGYSHRLVDMAKYIAKS